MSSRMIGAKAPIPASMVLSVDCSDGLLCTSGEDLAVCTKPSICFKLLLICCSAIEIFGGVPEVGNCVGGEHGFGMPNMTSKVDKIP